MKWIKVHDNGKVSAIHHTKKKEGSIEVDNIPESEKDPEKYNAQLYYDKDNKKLYYEYTEREDEDLKHE